MSIRWQTLLVLMMPLLACNGVVVALVPSTPTLTATATKTPTKVTTPTDTATPTLTPSPTETASPTATTTPTPKPKPTEPATATPTVSPTSAPTSTPVPVATAAPAPPPSPTAPPAPTETPAPAVDFRIASWRLWPLAQNSGCAKGMHTIFITVLDANGQPVNDIVVGDSWGNVETVSGSKGVGKAEIDLWTNTMEMVVKRHAASGEVYKSEVSFPFSSYMTTIPNELMIEAGYCSNELECDWKRQHDSYYCGGHYSWEVIFQATRPVGPG